MKSMFKFALVATTLALATSVTQAANTSASIPLTLTILKNCSISNVSPSITIPSDASAGTGGFDVTCNTPYSISTSTGNTASAQTFVLSTTLPNTTLDTIIAVSGDGNAVPVNGSTPLSRTGLAVDQYTISAALASPVTNITPAGTYTDVLNVSVDY